MLPVSSLGAFLNENHPVPLTLQCHMELLDNDSSTKLFYSRSSHFLSNLTLLILDSVPTGKHLPLVYIDLLTVKSSSRYLPVSLSQNFFISSYSTIPRLIRISSTQPILSFVCFSISLTNSAN